MFAGAAIIFFAYIGFDSVSVHSEEAKNPAKDVPIGIIASLIICTILYILVSAGFDGHGAIQRNQHRCASRGCFQASRFGLDAIPGCAAGAMTGITSVLLVMMLSPASRHAGAGARWFGA
jgi:APA family basic amino acid/polyamine antiporter